MEKDYHKILTDYYAMNGLLASDFRCKNYEQCKAVAKRGELCKGGSAHIGSNYGNPYRIVIVSLDRGDNHKGADSAELRTKVIEGVWTTVDQVNQHMTGTKNLLKALLEKKFDKEENLFTHYAMTNSAKCCGADGNSSSVHKVLYDNCSDFSLKEIELLEPELVVTEGQNAINALYGRFSELSDSDVSEIIKHLGGSSKYMEQIIKALVSEHIKKLSIGNEFAWLLILPHPSARGGQWQHFIRYFMELTGDIVEFLIEKKAHI